MKRFDIEHNSVKSLMKDLDAVELCEGVDSSYVTTGDQLLDERWDLDVISKGKYINRILFNGSQCHVSKF